MPNNICSPLLIINGTRKCFPLCLTYVDEKSVVSPVCCVYEDTCISPVWCNIIKNGRYTTICPLGIYGGRTGEPDDWSCILWVVYFSEDTSCSPIYYYKKIGNKYGLYTPLFSFEKNATSD
jgi:hypothetical protein